MQGQGVRVNSEINTKLMTMLPNLLHVFAQNENDCICSADRSNQRLGAVSPRALTPQALPCHLEGKRITISPSWRGSVLDF